MALSLAQIKHNACIVYDEIAEGNRARVYVDQWGYFQLDNRYLYALREPLGDYSEERVNALVLKTLRGLVGCLVKN